MTVAMEFAVDLSDYEAYMNPQNRDDYLVLVNKDHPMSADQEPSYDSMSEVGYEIRDGVKARFMVKRPNWRSQRCLWICAHWGTKTFGYMKDIGVIPA